MAIGEGVETHLGKQNLVTAQPIEVGDFHCLCRLQTLVGELLIKNELLRQQLRENDRIFARLYELFEKEETLSTTGTDVVSPLLQAYALLAARDRYPPDSVSAVRYHPGLLRATKPDTLVFAGKI